MRRKKPVIIFDRKSRGKFALFAARIPPACFICRVDLQEMICLGTKGEPAFETFCVLAKRAPEDRKRERAVARKTRKRLVAGKAGGEKTKKSEPRILGEDGCSSH